MSFFQNLFAASAGAKRIDGREAWRLVKERNALLVDVRTDEEFADGHAKGAVNIPLHELNARAKELPTDRPIVLYCRSGARSASAGGMLARQGFEVYDAGGLGALGRG
jgi:rhodanese-related sulfurtransferase